MIWRIFASTSPIFNVTPFIHAAADFSVSVNIICNTNRPMCPRPITIFACAAMMKYDSRSLGMNFAISSQLWLCFTLMIRNHFIYDHKPVFKSSVKFLGVRATGAVYQTILVEFSIKSEDEMLIIPVYIINWRTFANIISDIN
jgi:hypothetical protein